MPTKIIVSYDDTDNDRDALALGRLLAYSGAELALAYVRHSQRSEDEREALEGKHAQELLERGAAAIGAPEMARHVIVHASTGEGLLELAAREHADVVVFGSDYRTAPGAVQPGTSAQRLLGGGPVAVAIAPADLRSRPSVSIARVGVLDEGDEAARATASSLAATLGATVAGEGEEPVDFLVVGSRPEAPQGQVMLSAASEYAIATATQPVLVTPRGITVGFAASERQPEPPVVPSAA